MNNLLATFLSPLVALLRRLGVSERPAKAGAGLVFLLGLLGALGGVVLAIGRLAPPPDDWTWPRPATLDVRRIDIERPGQSFSLLYQDSGWRLALPGDVPVLADVARVDGLKAMVRHSKPLARLGPLDPQKAAGLGLDPPLALIRLVGDEVEWTISVGRMHGLGLYATSSLEPGQLLLLDPGYSELLSLSAEVCRDGRLLGLSPNEVSRFQVMTPESLIDVKRVEQDEYIFRRPDTLRDEPVDTSGTLRFLHDASTVRGATSRVESIPDLAGPVFSLVFWGDGRSSKQVIDFFRHPGRDGAWLARASRQSTLLELDQDQVAQLHIAPFSLQDRRLVDITRSDVWRMDLIRLGDGGDRATPGEGRLSARRRGDSWRGRGSLAGSELIGIDLLLWRLTNLKSQGVTAQDLPPDAKRALEWELKDESGARLASLLFATDQGLPSGQCWMLPPDGGPWQVVDDQLLRDVLVLIPVETEVADTPVRTDRAGRPVEDGG